MGAGSSIYSTLAFLFQEFLLSVKLDLPGSKMKGPFSWKHESRAEHPGAPENQTKSGSLDGLFCEGKKT